MRREDAYLVSTLFPIAVPHAGGFLVARTRIIISIDFFLDTDFPLGAELLCCGSVGRETLSKGIDGSFGMAMEIVGGEKCANGRT